MNKLIPLHTGKSRVNSSTSCWELCTPSCSSAMIIPISDSPTPMPIPKKNEPTVSSSLISTSFRRCSRAFLLGFVDLLR